MLRHILVPLDGSELADHALPVAGRIARQTGAEVHLVAVHRPLATTMLNMGLSPEVIDSSGELDAANEAELTEHLRRKAAGLREEFSATTTAVRIDGVAPVPEQLLHYVESHQIDLVVMTTHGRGALGRFLMGSVADTLVRTLTTPCLLLRGDVGENALSRVMVPLDGTEEAERALAIVLELLPAEHLEILLVQVVPPIPWVPPAIPLGGADFLAGFMADRQAAARSYLGQVASNLEQRGIRVRTVAQINSSPAATMLDLIEPERIDFVAMSARRRSGADRLLLGSVMDKVVRYAPVPVLVARS